MFEVNWSTVINWLMHPLMRTEFNLNFLNALLWPFKQLYNTFKTFRDDNLYTLDHSGQICYLQGALNDTFDIDLRRIFITDAGGIEVQLLYPDADLKEIIVQPDPDDSLLVYPDSFYNDGEYDFIVNVPFALSEAQVFQMKSLLDKYKLASKRYDIIITT